MAQQDGPQQRVEATTVGVCAGWHEGYCAGESQKGGGRAQVTCLMRSVGRLLQQQLCTADQGCIQTSVPKQAGSDGAASQYKT